MSAARFSYLWGPEAGPARAAVGSFPFAHRTVEEIDIIEADRWEHCLTSEKGPKREVVRAARPSTGPTFHRSNLPDAPCRCCGARGWCGHHGRVAA